MRQPISGRRINRSRQSRMSGVRVAAMSALDDAQPGVLPGDRVDDGLCNGPPWKMYFWIQAWQRVASIRCGAAPVIA